MQIYTIITPDNIATFFIEKIIYIFLENLNENYKLTINFENNRHLSTYFLNKEEAIVVYEKIQERMKTLINKILF